MCPYCQTYCSKSTFKVVLIFCSIWSNTEVTSKTVTFFLVLHLKEILNVSCLKVLRLIQNALLGFMLITHF